MWSARHGRVSQLRPSALSNMQRAYDDASATQRATPRLFASPTAVARARRSQRCACNPWRRGALQRCRAVRSGTVAGASAIERVGSAADGQWHGLRRSTQEGEPCGMSRETCRRPLGSARRITIESGAAIAPGEQVAGAVAAQSPLVWVCAVVAAPSRDVRDPVAATGDARGVRRRDGSRCESEDRRRLADHPPALRRVVRQNDVAFIGAPDGTIRTPQLDDLPQGAGANVLGPGHPAPDDRFDDRLPGIRGGRRHMGSVARPRRVRRPGRCGALRIVGHGSVKAPITLLPILGCPPPPGCSRLRRSHRSEGNSCAAIVARRRQPRPGYSVAMTRNAPGEPGTRRSIAR